MESACCSGEVCAGEVTDGPPNSQFPAGRTVPKILTDFFSPTPFKVTLIREEKHHIHPLPFLPCHLLFKKTCHCQKGQHISLFATLLPSFFSFLFVGPHLPNPHWLTSDSRKGRQGLTCLFVKHFILILHYMLYCEIFN